MRFPSYLVAGLLLACSTTDQNGAPGIATGHRTSANPRGVVARWLARADANGKVDSSALVRESFAHHQRLAGTPAASGGPTNWQTLGPGNIGGRVRSILIHPTIPTTMWIGSVSGGVWKTTNGGTSWTMLPDLPAMIAITCMVLHPNDPNTIFAGTGEQCFFNSIEGSSNSAVSVGAGVFKSTDGGNSWAQLPGTGAAAWNSVSRLTIDTNNPQILLASTISGIWRSVDGGATWSQRTTVKALDIEIDPNDSSKYVAGRADGIAQYSNDGGITWSNTAVFPNVNRVELAYAKSAPGMVYASTSVQGASITLWRSTDGGQTYAVRSTGTIVSTLANYDNALWVDPIDSNRVLVGGLDVYRSLNGGSAFTQISNWSTYQSNKNSAHADHHMIVADPGYNGTTNATVYFGNDGGIQKAANITTVTTTSGWTNLNTNLAITQLYGACINPTSSVVLCGAQDNGTSRGTPAGGVSGWTQPGGGDGSYCAADQNDPNYFYTQSQYIGLSRSSNAGVSAGTSIKGAINEPTPNFMAYILLDQNDSNRLYVCGAQLWRANNAKTSSPPTWTSIKPALVCPTSVPTDPPAHFDNNPPCNISTVAVAKGNSNIVWVGHNNGAVYYTTNALAAAPTWTKVDDNPTPLPDRWVSRIVIDADDATKVTVSFLGFAANNVWRTTNSGATWSLRQGTGTNVLPAVPVSCILRHQVIAARMFAGTDLGLFYSEDDGLNWLPALGGPSIVPVEEMHWKNNKTMILATHGRSVWSCDVDAASVTPVGTGCGLFGVPSLVTTPPAIGATQIYTLSAAAPSAPVTLLLAAGPAVPVQIGSCVVQPDLAGMVTVPFGSTNGSGGLIANLPIPANPAFLGAIVTVQELISVTGGPLLGVAELSNGSQMTFGF